MVRGPQTPGELKQRTERLHDFASLDAVHETLRRLMERELAVRLERRPGQKEERYAQLLGGGAPSDAGAAEDAGADRPATDGEPLSERLAVLEHRIAALEAAVAALQG